MTKPQIIALAVAVALLVVVVVLARMLILRRQTGGATHLASTLHLNARWWKEQSEKKGELLYVAIGDSAAQGVGASKPARSYVGLLARHLRERTGRTVRVINLSVSGARLREAIAKQLPEFRGLEPDLITVAIGANDIASFDAARFAREIDEIYAALPDNAIVSEVPAFYFGAAEANARTANRIIHATASRYGYEVAPLHGATQRQGVFRYAFNQVAADFFHPNDRGYRVWASAFLPLLDRRFPAALHTETESARGGDGGLV